MKYVVVTLSVLCSATFAYAGTSPEAYLTQIPEAPKNCCGIPDESKTSYKGTLYELETKMKKDLGERRKEAKSYAKTHSGAVASPMTMQPDGMEKSGKKSGKMSKEEKEAKKAEMMRQFGISPDDAKKLQSMSKEEKLAWAGKQSANADNKMQGDAKQANTNFELIQEQQMLVKKIQDRMAGFDEKFKALDQEADKLMEKEQTPIKKKLKSYGDIIDKKQEAQVKQDIKALNAVKKRYCETFSPRYRALLDEYLSAVKSCLPDYKKLEQITAKTQFGLDAPIEANDGYQGIEALLKYLPYLATSYKYDLALEN